MPTKYFRIVLAAILVAASTHQPRIADAQEKPQLIPKIISSIQGLSVTEDELNRASAAELEKLELQKLQYDANYERNRYQVIEKALVRLVEEKLLAAEATRQGITSAQLLANEVDKSVHDASDQEVNSFYEAYKARIQAPKEQAMTQIRQYLRQQSYNKAKDEFIGRLKKANGVSYSPDPMRTSLETAGYPSRGPAGAAVTIVEFSDFQCSFCKAVSSTLEKLLQDFSTDVRLVYRQFPLNEIHPLAQKAAEASLCAAEQAKFWPMYDLLFQEQGNLAIADLKAKAARLGLDTAAFNSCLDSGRFRDKIQQDLREGSRVGVTGTPALFINGRFLSGARPYDEIADVIKDEIRRKNAAGRPKE